MPRHLTPRGLGVAVLLAAVLLAAALLAANVPAARADGPAPQAAAAAAGRSTIAWRLSPVDTDGNVGAYASLAFQPGTGVPFIAYADLGNKKLRLASRLPPGATGNCLPQNNWNCIAWAGIQVGRFNSLAFDSAGTPIVVTWDEIFNMNEAAAGNMLTSSWALDTSGPAGAIVGWYNALRLNSANLLRVAYYKPLPGPSELRFFQQLTTQTGNCGPGSRGQCDIIDSGTAVGAFAALGLSGSDVPYIAYAGAGGVLRLAHRLSSATGNCGPGSTWQCDTIDPAANVTGFLSLHVPSCQGCLDTLQIAYYNGAGQNVKYASPAVSGGNCGPSHTWRCDVIDSVGSAGPFMGASLAVANAVPAIAYGDANDGANQVLKIARPLTSGRVGNCGPAPVLFQTWQCTVIDDGTRPDGYHDVGVYASLAQNAAGLATVAYYDLSAGDLDLAQEVSELYVPLIVRH